ncbi:hypothetical protein DSO57_1006716 [Entomophthora muscae]|uniref:Uncharacterized protein n=1 Tax=Entomophthora muscae TaxID=34485 RepID=A0ACC2UHJ0_9FUNG|nr:hypothetical protein DSO57_1006716 [Entomophthora muscae]
MDGVGSGPDCKRSELFSCHALPQRAGSLVILPFKTPVYVVAALPQFYVADLRSTQGFCFLFSSRFFLQLSPISPFLAVSPLPTIAN